MCVAGALSLVAPASGAQEGPPRAPTSLVVLVAVDQLRADYLERFGPQLTGGLARFSTRGALFTRAMQDHANTETAPGHSTMLSGREPTHTGIVSNDRGVPDPGSPLVGGEGEGASPRRFLGTTLYDWMRIADPRARVLSVSRKDRGAILPVGRARGSVLWWADGVFVTSRYYADTLPTWVRAFNDRHSADSLAGARWTPLLPASAYPEPDSVSYEHGGDDIAFPHRLPKDVAAVRRELQNYPWMDSLTLAFALEGVHALSLGAMGATDLLSVSLSTTDAIGHAYGPDSREIHDQVLRLDRWLGTFLDSLARLVPTERTVLVLTADHGVTSFPERIAAGGTQHGGRLSLDGMTRRVARALGERYAVDFALDGGSGIVLADTGAMHARGVRVDSLAGALAAELRGRPGIAEVYTPGSLARGTTVGAARWRRAIPRETGWLVCVVPSRGWVWSDGKLKAEHGTPSDDDVTVPIAFLGPGIASGTFADRIRTVDIAPTLAAYLGIRSTEPLDGRVVTRVMAQRTALR
jgi:hypothetical protein